jgi:hypothetical protein
MKSASAYVIELVEQLCGYLMHLVKSKDAHRLPSKSTQVSGAPWLEFLSQTVTLKPGQTDSVNFGAETSTMVIQ